MCYLKIKRLIDFIASLCLIFLLWPLFLFITVLIKIDSNGPIFFKQKRIGKNKKEFYIIKFRTMSVDAPDVPTHLFQNPDTYITNLGRILRKTSMDELPQLINILKGEMSFIGPRPALWNFYELISERDKYGVNNILPGLSGWAQVNGRDEIPTQAKAQYDAQYMQNLSFLFDLKIFLRTIPIVLFSKGFIEGDIRPSKDVTLNG